VASSPYKKYERVKYLRKS